MLLKKISFPLLLILLWGSFADFSFSQSAAPVALRWTLTAAEVAAWPKCTTAAPAACITDFAVSVFTSPTTPGPLQSVAYSPGTPCSTTVITNCADAAGYRGSVLLSQLGPLPTTSGTVRLGVAVRAVNSIGLAVSSPQVVVDLPVQNPPAVSNLAVAQTTSGATIAGVSSSSIAPPPVFLTGPSVGSITATTAVVDWTTDIASNTQVSCGVNGGPYTVDTPSPADPLLVLPHSVLLGNPTPLIPSTTYYCVAKSQAAVGAPGISTQFSFTTAASVTDGPPDYPGGYYGIDTVAEGTWAAGSVTLNSVFTAPTLAGTSTVRAMDTSVNPCNVAGQTGNSTAVPDSAESNIFNTTSTKYVVRLLGGSSSRWFLNTFDPTTMQSAPHAGTGSGGCRTTGTTGWWEVSGTNRFKNGAPFFSYVNADLIYGIKSSGNTTILKADASTQGFTTLKLLTDASNCFPDLSTAASGDLVVSYNDDRFMWVGNIVGDPSTGQDNYTVVVVYSQTLGCRRFRFGPGQGVIENGTGSWGGYPVGAIGIPTRELAHNARMTKDGKWVWINPGTCSGTANCGPVIWEVESTQVVDCLVLVSGNQRCNGHTAEGWESQMTGYSSGSASIDYYPYTTIPLVRQVIAVFTASEKYMSWSNAATGETAPVMYVGMRSNGAGSNGMCIQEVCMIKLNGNVAREVNICRSKPVSAFNSSDPRAVLSQDGRFVIWPTNGTLCGVDAGHIDLYIAKLK